MTSSLAARRLALAAFYFIPGMAIASWVTRTPAIRDALGASIAEMGGALFGLSVGSMAGILCSAALVRRFGTKPVILVGVLAVIVGLPTLGLGAELGIFALATAGLALFGAGAGSAEVAMNVEGAEVERLGGKSFLPVLHGCFSLGTAAGALAGIAFTASDFPVLGHLLIVAVVALVIVVFSTRPIPSGFGREARRAAGEARPAKPKVWRDPVLLLICFVLLAMALAEGSANDWLPLLMVDDYGLSEAWGSIVFTLFVVAMTVGRFCGGPLVDRFGNAKVLAVSAMSAVAGIVLIVVGQDPVVALIAVLLWGLGASPGFPVAISAAGSSGPDATARVSIAATAGYVAFLVGPPLLGFVGEEVGLRGALLIPLALVVLAVFANVAISRRETRASAGDVGHHGVGDTDEVGRGEPQIEPTPAP